MLVLVMLIWGVHRQILSGWSDSFIANSNRRIVGIAGDVLLLELKDWQRRCNYCETSDCGVRKKSYCASVCVKLGQRKRELLQQQDCKGIVKKPSIVLRDNANHRNWR